MVTGARLESAREDEALAVPLCPDALLRNLKKISLRSAL